MPVGGKDFVVGPEVLLDRPGLGGRFNNQEVSGHRRGSSRFLLCLVMQGGVAARQDIRKRDCRRKGACRQRPSPTDGSGRRKSLLVGGTGGGIPARRMLHSPHSTSDTHRSLRGGSDVTAAGKRFEPAVDLEREQSGGETTGRRSRAVDELIEGDRIVTDCTEDTLLQLSEVVVRATATIDSRMQNGPWCMQPARLRNLVENVIHGFHELSLHRE